MTNPHRIGIILGTRPEAIKLAPVIQVFQSSPDFELQVILTGQHREMVEQVMKLFKLKADWNLEIMQRQQSLHDITCRSLQGLEALFQAQKLDFVIVQGDTTTAFAATLAAFYQKIPVGHVEAGLRTDDLFNTVIDALLNVAAKKPVCDILGLDWHKYRTILATVHRRENWGEPLENIAQSFLQILDQFPDTALLLPLHKNPTVREPLQELLGKHPRIFLTEPLDYAELVGAIERSYLILTDSGGLQEEAPSLGKPVLVLRDTTERPEAVTAGTAKLVGTQTESIVTAASELLRDSTAYMKMANAINPFGDGHAAERILRLVKNYLLRELNT